MLRRVRKFLGEVHSEIKKVSWTRRNELFTSTLVVMVIVVLLAIFVGIIDRILSEIIGLVIGK